MKKLIYGLAVAATAMIFSSCGGHEEYETYVATLKAQPALIDTISSPASYANYLDSLAEKASAFDKLGVKLDPTQQDNLSALSVEIQEALTRTYNRLAQTPMPLDEVMEAVHPVDSVAPEEVVIE